MNWFNKTPVATVVPSEEFVIIEETADFVTVQPPYYFKGVLVTKRNAASQLQHLRDTTGLEVVAVNTWSRFIVCKRVAQK
jgi:hypothetical protein